jgi:2,4-dienoyl-CoA reductase-like NADH-dependent reductase (Old Yellow Enzyme family)
LVDPRSRIARTSDIESAAADGRLFQPAEIGSVQLRNRIVRAATVETMAGEGGEVMWPLVRLHEGLAMHNVGLTITGGMYVHPRGQSTRFQTGIYADHLIEGLSAVPEAVHRHGGRVFAQLQHSGNQSSVVRELVSPGERANLLTGRKPLARATTSEIWEVVWSFGNAARRAVAAGFDGVHLHGANGYLISSFSSPYSNQRSDEWGGTAAKRSRVLLEIVKAVRAAVPADYPVTLKLGLSDAVTTGLQVEEAVERVALMTDAGVDAVEVSVNLMRAPEDSAKRYVAVDRGSARKDLIFRDVDRDGTREAYFTTYSHLVRERCSDTRIILVGGLRSLPTMQLLIDQELADFVALSRPFIREPDLVDRLRAGGLSAACTSCNLCLEHSGSYSLRCWRKPRRRLLHSAAIKLAGKCRRRRGPDR